MKLFSVLSVLFIITLLSCGGSIDNDIKTLLDSRKSAFEEKNPEKYAGLILTNYNAETRNGKKSKDDVLKDFKLNTTPFDSIVMSHSDRKVSKEEGRQKLYKRQPYCSQLRTRKQPTI